MPMGHWFTCEVEEVLSTFHRKLCLADATTRGIFFPEKKEKKGFECPQGN